MVDSVSLELPDEDPEDREADEGCLPVCLVTGLMRAVIDSVQASYLIACES